MRCRHLNATTGTAADAGGGEAAQRARGHFLPRHCTDAELRAQGGGPAAAEAD